MDYYLKYDLYRYFYPDDKTVYLSNIAKLKKIILTQAIWALIVYRTGSWCVRNKKRLGHVALFLLPLLTICQKLVEVATGIEIPFTAKIGKGLYIGHFGQIIISPQAILGECCNISQGVTIGQAGRGLQQYTPIIGNRVYIAPGAKIFGQLTVGNDVAIGANAVVTKDLPDNAVAVGVPAQIISFDSSRDFINFNHQKMQDI
jgi:serine O-acetyltransferase